MIRTIYRHRTGAIVTDLSHSQLEDAASDSRGTLWVDMEAPTEDEFDLILRQLFPFHPLAVEDAINDVHSPKIDDYGDILYIVYHAISLGDERMDIHTSEIDVFLSRSFLVTVHDQQYDVFDRLQEIQYHEQGGLARGPAFLLYELMDRQLDSYVSLVDGFEEHMEELGDLIFDEGNRGSRAILNDLLTAKSSALRVRRVLVPQREALDRLARADYAAIPMDARIYFRDVHDHLARLAALAESMRDLATSTIETHLVLVNNRTNEIMKVLTVFAAIFIPLGFLASVYGMNFDYMPELHSVWGYPLLWLVFLGIVGGMLGYFRHRRWI